MLDEIENKGTAVDIVFNNAAVQIGYRTDYWKAPIQDFHLSFRINITSGIKDQPEQAGYSASKAALDKFTTDLGTKVKVPMC